MNALAAAIAPASEAVLKTLLVSDLVASTRLMELLGDERMADVFRRHDRLARDLLHRCEGREADRTDGFLMLFERPLHAVRYALAFHRAMADLSREVGVELGFRVGIHLGEVVLIETPPEDVARGAKPLEVEGLAKPVAARLMSLAQGRQTLLSQAAFEMARRGWVGNGNGGHEELRWLAHGEYLLKGVAEPMPVFEVGEEELAPLTAPPDTEKVRRVTSGATILGWRPAVGQAIDSRPNWELERKLGEGGFGEVWLARHQKTGDRRAFKFCFAAERLRGLEREITLFRLLKEELGDRDDIARIFDWNFDEAPYFIEAEYTAGGNLLEWAEAQGGLEQVPLTTRLEIVAQVAEALAAAHSVGVLHKDVKPANVLIHTEIDGRPRARLTDFGIGLVTDASRLAEVGITVAGMTRLAGSTEVGSGAGTRLYEAPELVEGKAATVQADVYALGVMLYQLIVGDLWRALGPGWERHVDDELLREDIAVAVDVSPKRRLGNALRLAERLRALPERREERAAAAREREEAARNEAALARARKRRKVFAGVIAVLALFAGAVTLQNRRVAQEAERANREAERANREAVAAQQVLQFMVDLFKVSDPGEARGNAITARELLERGAERIRGELEEQPLIQARLMETIGTVYRELGLFDPAQELLEEALAVRRRLLAPDHLDLASSLRNLAILYRQRGRFAEAETLYQEALAIRQEVVGVDHPTTADLLNNLAILYRIQGRYAEAEPLYQRAREVRERLLGPDHPDVAETLNGLAILYWQQGRYPEVEPLYRQALQIRENALGPDHPDVAKSLNNLANLCWTQERYAEAEPYYRRALAIRQQVLDAAHPDVGESLHNLGELYRAQGRYAEAEPYYRRALAVWEQALGPDHILAAHSLHGLATLYSLEGRRGEAEALYRRALTIRQKVLVPDHPDLVDTRDALAALLHDQGRGAEARALTAPL